ncbi:16S rRNA (cytidine(1402)-2'-O)-methyltransferase [Guggenheimella bovis]
MSVTFVATPIGNLKDITIRALETLKESDIIACEDTRHTRKLLSHYDIHVPLMVYDDHHDASGLEKIIAMHQEGKNIAVVSDAGMPVVSDPGVLLVRELIKLDIPFSVLPGPSAFVNAWVLSGIESSSFTFFGFLPRRKKERLETLEELKNKKEALIFYEAVHRIDKTVEDILSVFGNRMVSLSRELTKLYEETIRTDLEGLKELLRERELKGELVLVVEGCQEEEQKNLEDRIEEVLQAGYSKSDAAKLIAKEYGLAKNEVYQLLVNDK